MAEESLFIEQAENIEPEELLGWSEDHPKEKQIIQKLSKGGAKLVTGPRGCGKTTLLLKTYYKLINKKRDTTFPVYVNFKSSLKLEPYYSKSANAPYWFNQWIIFKIYQGIFLALKDAGFDSSNKVSFSEEYVKRIVGELELGKSQIALEESATIEGLAEDVKSALSQIGKNRCVVLLDDAAHAFSSQQQADFFDFFRQIKSKQISPKAAVYPGVTSFSSSFHVGHDAEEIDVWLKPDEPEYLSFMKGLLKKRLPEDVYVALEENEDAVNVLCFSSFGVPRSLLNMVRNFYEEKSLEGEDGYDIDLERNKVLKAVTNCFENSYYVFESLRNKLPMYEKFIENGGKVFDATINRIKDYNKDKPADQQSVDIAIKKPLFPEVKKIIGFFQYSGLILPRGDTGRGEKGVFEVYTVHYAALIKRNALFGKRAKNLKNINKALSSKPHQAYARTNPSYLIGSDDPASVFPLSLPPCQVCQSPRPSEDAKFCPNCGNKLQSVSIFEYLIAQDISALPLTDKRVETIKDNSDIATIKDILMDDDKKRLRGVPQIGEKWANRIYSYAEEYLG